MADFFRRVEKKYILTKNQYQLLKDSIKEKMLEDEHGESTICNIYFDTADYDLIRHSITKPVYKDKIRLRSYNIPKLDSKVYLEVKRKFEGVVSKRRIEMTLSDLYDYLNNKSYTKIDCQVKRELDYYFDYYKLEPAMFLSYSRSAFYEKGNKDFRLTFDSNILARSDDLNLEKGNYGNNIIDENTYIMEVKTLGAMPMWFVEILNKINISPCGFSKYGEAYTRFVLKSEKMIV